MKSAINRRIERLQALLQEQHLTGWIITGTDPHQTEYLPPHWMEREGITGFTGSAGSVVVLQDSIHLWTDSRYHVQAEQELEGTTVELHRWGNPGVKTYKEWIKAELPKGSILGIDGMTIGYKPFLDMEKELTSSGISLRSMENLFHTIWDNRPEQIQERVIELSPTYTGESREDRITWVGELLQREKANYLLVNDLSEIGYILNLRGTAQSYNPIFEGYLLFSQNSTTPVGGPGNLPQTTLYTDISAIDQKLQATLSQSLTIRPYHAIAEDFTPLEGTVIIDPTTAPYGLIASLSPETVLKEITPHPITTRKGIKTKEEIKSLRETHIIDGVAMANFLCWFDSVKERGTIQEWDAVEKIRECRERQPNFMDESFATIAGYQQNGVLNHYHPSKESSAQLSGAGLMVFDSGGQYLCGTTDITRTLLVGDPTAEQISDYTAVLKGHISLARATFPVGTYGHQLDILARKPLWDLGLNYGHGTGHGVGFYMNVHEGPMRISPGGSTVALEPGMYISNEPGLYREGKHGIRLENMVLVESRQKTEFAQWLGFETLTLTPFEQKLIQVDMLSPEEREWINSYHKQVYKSLAPHLEEPVRAWLERATTEL